MKIIVDSIELGWDIDCWCDCGEKLLCMFVPNRQGNLKDGVDTPEEAKSHALTLTSMLCEHCTKGYNNERKEES